MKSKVALITGGARGIGKGIALTLAAQGWAIALCYRTSQQDAEKTCQAIQALGGQALPIRSDVSDPNNCQALVQQVEAQWGRIDALINGAGPYHRINLFDETPEGWNEMFTNNLHPIFYLAKVVTPGMKTRKYGRIISFSMANADKMEAQPMVTAHYIAKAGILILTRTLAKMLAPEGITVNAISPGFIDSGSAPPGELDGMEKKIPAGYVGKVKDTISAVQYLLSEEARYVTGTNIHVSGGWGM
ncbi:SDR family NAD(P)-dependent oxidoreductase [Candidatus Nitronereus thalassa]|uniref:SDR family oxidoreductase n=1 Tax=Candidatus Nitronereus thalassa TaxID=3020898 RepID=A0ABU3KA45_9BACT|nr:SDR family oxidoreductase [Candidatus Nitronereus thalassa]MDT7043252.1 SDR family oxidoreductase [Candidatus Nitronereus thalassa]